MNFRDDIDSLILKLVTGDNAVIKQEKLRALKQILRKSGINSNSLVTYTYDKVTEYLEVYDSLTRYLSVVVINELFTGFPDFRSHFLFNYDLRHFFDLTILGTEKPTARKTKKKKGTEEKKEKKRKRMTKPKPLMLPPPVEYIQNLRTKALESFELWYRQYGLESQVLRVGYQYLKNKHGIKFPSEKKSHEGIVMNRKFERIKSEIGEYKGSIEEVLVQVDNCLKMVIPENLESTDDFDEDEDDDESEEEDDWVTLDDENEINEEDDKVKGTEEEELEMENVISDFGLVNKDYHLSVEIDRKELKNHKRKCDPIFEDKIKEFVKELRKRYYPMVLEWSTTLEVIRVRKFQREEMEFKRICGYVTKVQQRMGQVFNQVEEIGIIFEENGEREKNVFNLNTRKRKRNDDDDVNFDSRKDHKKRKI